jgi:hypothetical protein
VVGRRDAESIERELVADHVGDPYLVVYDQDAFRSGRGLGAFYLGENDARPLSDR